MPTKNSYLTVTDQFCGAGGSSIGAEAAGATLQLALNHWQLAIDTHNTNFPHADHDCTDISACDPRRYRSSDILITSPECTNHSLAKGKKRKWQQQLELFGKVTIDPAEERSRATMWDVPRFAEFHSYNIIIVENVVDARYWATWDAWLHAMDSLGYDHQVVYLNSMFAHVRPRPDMSLAKGDYAPQSRDRMYVVFWKKGNRKPDLEIRPLGWCGKCGRDVETAGLVRQAREMVYNEGKMVSALAQEWGINYQTLHSAVVGATWQLAGGPLPNIIGKGKSCCRCGLLTEHPSGYCQYCR